MLTAHTDVSAGTEPSPAAPAISILLFAAESSAARVAQRLAAELQAVVTMATDERRCVALLQHRSFALVVIEEVLAQEHAADLKMLYDLAADTFILEVNFGVCSADRILRQIRAALVRRDLEYRQARQAAMLSLQQQLSHSVAGLLFESQLALRSAGPEVAPALEHLVLLAEALCEQLRS